MNQIQNSGFEIINAIYSNEEINSIISLIENTDSSNATFRKSADLFAIRQFLREIPKAKELLFNEKLRDLIHEKFGSDYFITKSIYFDKPKESNWFVAYHQDLTISVIKKVELAGYGPWTVKQDQFAVQPPLDILENIFTIRIHLDDTDESNGALKVIEGSHLQGIRRPETIDLHNDKEFVCNAKRGGVMLMKPLLLHSSSRSKGDKQRRVIHIEFSNKVLLPEIEWSERIEV